MLVDEMIAAATDEAVELAPIPPDHESCFFIGGVGLVVGQRGGGDVTCLVWQGPCRDASCVVEVRRKRPLLEGASMSVY